MTEDLNPYNESLLDLGEPAESDEQPVQTQIQPEVQPKPRPKYGLSDQKTRVLLIKLAKAFRRHQARMSVRDDLQKHVSKIKRNVMPKQDRAFDLNQHLKELQQKVNNVVRVESNPDYQYHSKMVNQRLEALEKKLRMLMESKLEREKRFSNLDKKVSLKLDADKQIMNELEKKLLILQKKIIEHKIKGKKSKDLDHLHERIKATKSALDSMRNS